MKNEGTQKREIFRYQDHGLTSEFDPVAVEEPLEIEIDFTFLEQPARRSLAVTMRTPGKDEELATGFLFSEKVIESTRDLRGFEVDPEEPNRLRVLLQDHVKVDMASVQRNFYTTSSCGVCGKASLEALAITGAPSPALDDATISAELICTLPDALRCAQPGFLETGGMHGAALFNSEGALLTLFEDVGRHNAMDKLVGHALLEERLPLRGHIIVLSGRASFELLQKALRAHAPVIVCVGAPSTLAIDVAHQFGITLVGFADARRFNIYTHEHRVTRARHGRARAERTADS